KAFAVSGAGAQGSTRSLIPFGQALSATRGLSGDELKSLSENFPILLTAIARGTGRAYGELVELGAQGKLTGQIISQAIASQADFIEKAFTTRIRTIDQALNQVVNAITRAAGSANLKPLVDAISGLAKEIDDPQFQ